MVVRGSDQDKRPYFLFSIHHVYFPPTGKYKGTTQTQGLQGRNWHRNCLKPSSTALPTRSDLHFHSLRHGGAIFRLKGGWGIYDVNRLLTHASVTTTEKYLSALDNEERRRFGL